MVPREAYPLLAEAGRVIQKLLIANRGEIAVRIAQTCRRLGIRSVAVFSDADRDSLHVVSANEAHRLGSAESHRLGSAEARLSYLDIDTVVGAATAAGADAVHPGYGFLAESAEFAEACIRAGLIFVGPHPEAIRTMGSKQAARGIAERLGVPVVPGYHEDGQDEGALAEAARRIGYPLMIKASAGGGGKGIRIVESKAGFATALATVKREARSAFGEEHVILESYVRRSRHVEVQIMADGHGTVLALFDRDCSIQRNRQKLIEEAPAPALAEEVRERLHRDAILLAREIGYDSAGTVEFIGDPATDSYYFLEMNTRLQVEHPVTELVTGLDLVELQLRSAAGEVLDLDPASLRVRGCAIEARITAERPEKSFQPDTGMIHAYDEPAIEHTRIDTGVSVGSVVTPYYDSLLAKVIAWGENRDAARRRLADALEEFVIAGVATNQDFLRDVVTLPAMAAADLSTDFLSRHVDGWRPSALRRRELATAAALAWVLELERVIAAAASGHAGPWEHLGAWRILRRAGYEAVTEVVLEDADGERWVVCVRGNAGEYQVRHACEESPDQSWVAVRAARTIRSTYRLEIEGALVDYVVAIDGPRVFVSGRGARHNFSVLPRGRSGSSAGAAPDSARNLRATFPGVIVEVRVAPGDNVQKGETLLVMEAMKMVHNFNADGDGKVRAVHCAPGETVDTRHLLVEFEPEPS